MSTTTRPSWRVLVLAYLASLAFAFSFQMIPPLIPLLVGEHGLSHGGAGLLMGLFTLPGIFFSLPGGVLGDRVGHGRVALISLALMTAGTALMLPLSPAALFSGRLLAGCGGAVLVTVVPPILNRAFSGPRTGLAMGIFNTGVPLGTLVTFNLLGGIARHVGLATVLAGVAGLCAATGLCFWLGYQDHPGDWAGRKGDEAVRPPVPPRAGFSLRGLGAGLWILALAWGLYNMAVLGFMTFAADFLVLHGFAPGAADFTASLPMLASIGLLPLAGALVRTPRHKGAAILAGCAVPAAAILLILADPPRSTAWTVLMGVGMGAIPPAVFTAVPLLAPPGRVATGFGLLNTVFNLFVFAGIPAVGVLRDAHGGYDAGFIVLAAAGFAGAAATIALMRRWKATMTSPAAGGAG
jgi:MFS family permease